MALTLAQLRSLAAVADSGSFTRAAGELGVGQSAVSHAVAALEREIGGRLVRRDGSTGLTALGERVLARARRVLREVEALETSVAPTAQRGAVRLAAPPTVCAGLLPGLRSIWAVTMPEVDIQLYEGDDEELPEWLESGTVDLAVLVDPDSEPPHAVLVGTDELAAVVRSDHPLAAQPTLSLQDVHDDGLIAGGGGCERQLRRLHEIVGLPYRYEHRVRDMATIFAMIERAEGVAVLPTLGRDLVPPGLVMRPLRTPVQRRLVLTGPFSRPWNPLARALADSVRPSAADVPS